MRKTLPVFCCLLLYLNASLKAQQLEWYLHSGSMGDETNLIFEKDSQGNIYHIVSFGGSLSGQQGINLTAPTTGVESFYMAKYDSLGNILFTKPVFSTSFTDYLDVKNAFIDQNQNMYICGELVGTIDFDPDAGTTNLSAQGDTDIFFAKYNSNGNLVFAKSLGSAASESVSKMAADSQGNIYLYGNFSEPLDFDPGAGVTTRNPANSNGRPDIYLAKYNTSGNLLFVHAIGYTNSIAAPSIGADRLLLDENDNVYITGNFAGIFDFDPGAGDASRTSFGFDPNSNAFTTDRDYFIAKYSSTGAYAYVNVFSSRGSLPNFTPNVLLIENNELWMIHSDNYRSFDLDPGVGEIYSTGFSTTNYLVKYDQNGNYFTGTGIDLPLVIQKFSVLEDGNFLVWGDFQSTIDFAPGLSIETRTSNSASSDVFLAKYDNNFNLDFVYTFGGSGYETADFGLLYGQKDIVIAGSFDFFTTLGQNAPRTLSGAGGADIFTGRFRLRPLDAEAFVRGGTNICTSSTQIQYRIPDSPGATEYHWNIPNGASASPLITTAPELGIMFNQVTSGAITVTPVNIYGEGKKSSLNVTVEASPNAAFTSNDANNQICGGESITFTAIPGQGTYEFYVNGVLEQSGTNPQYIYTSPSSQSNPDIQLVVTNANNCTDQSMIFLNVNQLPSTGFTGDTIICEGDNVALFAEEQGANLYIWRRGTSIIGTSAILAMNDIATTGTGSNYSLEVNAEGCSSIRNFSVQVNPGPNNTIRQECITNTGSLTIELRATEQTADNYIWKRGNTIIGTTANVTLVNPNITGLKEYQLTLTKNGCTSTSEAFALSVSVPEAAGFIAGPIAVFRGQTQADYSISPINGATSYIWSLPPGAQAINATIITSNPVMLVETLTPNIRLNYALNAFDGVLSVRGRNDCNGEGQSSALNVFMIPFPNPENLIATTLSGSSIELFWEDKSGGTSSTEIERSLDPVNFAPYTSVSPGTNTWVDNNVQIGIRYYYRVRSFSGNIFSGYSNVAATLASNVPIAPSGLSATVLSPSEVQLDWLDNATNEAGFRIDLSNILTNNIFVEVATPGANTQQFIITGLEPNQVYFFRVKAGNIEGDSPYSNIVEVEMPPRGGNNVPQAPENVLAESVSETQINLTWEDAQNNAAIYKIQRSKGDANNFEEVGRLPAGSSTFFDTGLQPEAFYFYRIIAANADGNAPPSDTSAAQAICNLRVLVTREDANGNTICNGKAALLQLTTNVQGGRYQWKRDGINIPNANLATFLADREGDYSCEVTTGGCRKESQTGLVLIQRDQIEVSIQMNTNTGELIASQSNADAYQWYLDGEAIPGANRNSFRPVLSGGYYVIVSFQNSECAASSEIYYFNITGIEDFELSKKLLISPNPAYEEIHLELETTLQGTYQITLIAPNGKRFQIAQGNKTQNNWQENLNIKDLSAGFYLLEMKISDRILVKRLIKN
ncbi:MAG: fibronectin type III domain-containing protein [Microscillaceae bacterium]|nr:fibronectin type III domain-containing protein [Microscillaceae bacterium]